MSTTPTVIGRGPRLIDWRIVRFSMIFLLGSCMPQYALHRFAIYESSEVNTTLQQRGDIREISPGVKFSVMKVNGKAYKLFQLLFWMEVTSDSHWGLHSDNLGRGQNMVGLFQLLFRIEVTSNSHWRLFSDN